MERLDDEDDLIKFFVMLPTFYVCGTQSTLLNLISPIMFIDYSQGDPVRQSIECHYGYFSLESTQFLRGS